MTSSTMIKSIVLHNASMCESVSAMVNIVGNMSDDGESFNERNGNMTWIDFKMDKAVIEECLKMGMLSINCRHRSSLSKNSITFERTPRDACKKGVDVCG